MGILFFESKKFTKNSLSSDTVLKETKKITAKFDITAAVEKAHKYTFGKFKK